MADDAQAAKVDLFGIKQWDDLNQNNNAERMNEIRDYLNAMDATAQDLGDEDLATIGNDKILLPIMVDINDTNNIIGIDDTKFYSIPRIIEKAQSGDVINDIPDFDVLTKRYDIVEGNSIYQSIKSFQIDKLKKFFVNLASGLVNLVKATFPKEEDTHKMITFEGGDAEIRKNNYLSFLQNYTKFVFKSSKIYVNKSNSSLSAQDFEMISKMLVCNIIITKSMALPGNSEDQLKEAYNALIKQINDNVDIYDKIDLKKPAANAEDNGIDRLVAALNNRKAVLEQQYTTFNDIKNAFIKPNIKANDEDLNAILNTVSSKAAAAQPAPEPALEN
jgi:hypothetical protein